MQIWHDYHAKLIFGITRTMLTRNTTAGYKGSTFGRFESFFLQDTPTNSEFKKSFFLAFRKKVKRTLVQELGLCAGHTAHKGSRGIALPIHEHGTIGS